MTCVDNPYTTCIRFVISNEKIAFYKIAIAMTHDETAFTFIKNIAANGVFTRLDRYDFHLATATIKVVVFNNRFRIGQ